jgi:predicted HicB family RNase H-like nuclease
MGKAAPLRTVPAREARINIRVTEKLHRELVALARADRRSLSAYVEAVLTDHVEQAGSDSRKRR